MGVSVIGSFPDYINVSERSWGISRFDIGEATADAYAQRCGEVRADMGCQPIFCGQYAFGG